MKLLFGINNVIIIWTVYNYIHVHANTHNYISNYIMYKL